jgi:hypothetical protein
LKALLHSENPQIQISDTEVMTTAIIAVLLFAGNRETVRTYCTNIYIPNMLDKSCFDRRFHRIADLLTLFSLLGEIWKEQNECSICLLIVFRSLHATTIGSVPAIYPVEKSSATIKPAKGSSSMISKSIC